MEKSENILKSVKKEICSGEYGNSGDKFTTAHNFAKRFNISYVTAVNIIKRLCAEHYLISVNHRYYICGGTYDKKSEFYKKINLPKSNLIGVYVRELNNPFFSELAHIICEQLDKAGYTCAVMTSNNDYVRENKILNDFIKLKCIGIISFPIHHKSDDLASFLHYPLPYVIMGLPKNNLDATYIVTDNYESGRQAAKHLLSCGYENFAYAGYITESYDLRFKGYLEFLKEKGITIHKDLLFDAKNASDIKAKTTASALEKNLGKNGVGIFCHHDMFAAKMLNICSQNQISCPQDVGIIGYDNLPIAGAEQLNMTTFAYNYSLMASLAIEKLLNNIKRGGPAKKDISYIQTILNVRGSTRQAGDSPKLN